MAYNPVLLKDILKTYFPFGAIKTVELPNAKVFEDVFFALGKRFSIPASGTYNIVVDPTALDGSGKTLVVQPIVFKAVGAGPVFGDIYFGTTAANDGTLCQPKSRDHTTGTSSQTIVRMAPTISADGTKLEDSEFMIASDGVAATASVGGESRSTNIVKARTDGKYMFRLVNQDGTAAAKCLLALDFFEVEPS